MIITAANAVSRASVAASSPPPSMIVRISATSMTVTASASVSEPNGSPTFAAITSAWCTAVSTLRPVLIATTTITHVGTSRPQVAASVATPRTGNAIDHHGLLGECALTCSNLSGGTSLAEAADELEAGPRLVDGGDLDVDEAGGECHLADDVLGHVGRHPRGLLGPADPDHPRGHGVRGDDGEPVLEAAPVGDEQQRQVDVLREPAHDARALERLLGEAESLQVDGHARTA